jgi:hypothetical protein
MGIKRIKGITGGITAALAALAGAIAPLALPAGAGAGEYVVAQCDGRHAGYEEAHFDRTDGAYYEMVRGCRNDAQGRALRIENIAAAPVGAEGRIHFSAPPGTGITGVAVDASLRSDAGHRARLSFIDAAGNQAGRIATGSDEPGGFERRSQRLDGVGRAGFAALLICAEQRPCPESDQARSAIRDIRLTVRDRAAPTVVPSGTLLGGGWVRGSRTLGATARDVGSGIRTLEVTVRGRPVAPSRTLRCATAGAGSLVVAMTPCPRSATGSAALDTGRAPFANGPNAVRVCARDYGAGANLTCAARTVLVDNLPPAGAFRAPSRSDPELITASLADAHSGIAYAAISMRPLAGGAWRPLETRRVPGGVATRVDSSAVPPGRWAFRLVAVDRAGNARVIDRMAGGRPMVLELPLLERTRLTARIETLGHRARYGARPVIRGRLRTETGAGVRTDVAVIERFEPGAEPRRRVHRVETGPRGAYRTRLSSGPSRSVVVRFAGSRRLLPSASRKRKLAVTGKATMRLSRKRLPAGGRVRFRGRIGTVGARVPAPGKVVELQVREQGKRRFRTVGDAIHSGRNGRVRTSYRFGRFYRSPVRFAFRLKVTRQAGWPYRAPTHSRPKRLTVVPRR